MESLNESSVLVLIVTVVFFAGIAWEHLSSAPSDVVRVAVGVSAVVLALSALFALL